MRREDWLDPEEARWRRMRARDERDPRALEDYGQADYSDLYGYDPKTRSGYARFRDGRGAPYDDGAGDRRTWDDGRTWDEGPDRRNLSYAPDRRGLRRDGPSDRVLWAVIMERLDHARRLDLRHVEVDVRDGEVTLNGTVRHKSDKRRIEDIADIEGVRNVQNNLRVRESRWTLF